MVCEWDQNPIASGDKPDVLAPVHYAAERDNQYPFVWAASSFAAPVVSGCVAGILSSVGTDPAPFTIQEAILDTAMQYDSVPIDVFDATGTRDTLTG